LRLVRLKEIARVFNATCVISSFLSIDDTFHKVTQIGLLVINEIVIFVIFKNVIHTVFQEMRVIILRVIVLASRFFGNRLL